MISFLSVSDVVEVKGFVEIDAGEDGENIGLQERDQQFQQHDGDDQQHGRDRQRRQHAARGAQRDHEAGEHRQHGVARQHVGEQTDRKADRAGEEGDHFDRHQQEQQMAAAHAARTA